MSTGRFQDLFLASAGVAGALIGLLFVVASLLSLLRVRKSQPGQLRDAAFLAVLVIALMIQLVAGLMSVARPHAAGPVRTIAVLVIVCFVIGISRSWELIGGPSIGFRSEVVAMIRARRPEHDEKPAG